MPPVRLRPAIVLSKSAVTVPELMTAMSFGPGAAPPSHLVGSAQSPVPPTHVKVAAGELIAIPIKTQKVQSRRREDFMVSGER